MKLKNNRPKFIGTVQFTGIVVDSLSINGRVYPSAVINNAFTIANHQCYLTSREPTSVAPLDLRDVIGKVTGLNVNANGIIEGNVFIFNQYKSIIQHTTPSYCLAGTGHVIIAPWHNGSQQEIVQNYRLLCAYPEV